MGFSRIKTTPENEIFYLPDTIGHLSLSCGVHTLAVNCHGYGKGDFHQIRSRFLMSCTNMWVSYYQMLSLFEPYLPPEIDVIPLLFGIVEFSCGNRPKAHKQNRGCEQFIFFAVWGQYRTQKSTLGFLYLSFKSIGSLFFLVLHSKCYECVTITSELISRLHH